jgi:hypothetical protein
MDQFKLMGLFENEVLVQKSGWNCSNIMGVVVYFSGRAPLPAMVFAAFACTVFSSIFVDIQDHPSSAIGPKRGLTAKFYLNPVLQLPPKNMGIPVQHLPTGYQGEYMHNFLEGLY